MMISGLLPPELCREKAFRAITEINDALFANLKKRKSEATSLLESPGLPVSFRDDGGDVFASLALRKEKIRKIVDLAKKLSFEEKLAGKLLAFVITSCAPKACT